MSSESSHALYLSGAYGVKVLPLAAEFCEVPDLEEFCDCTDEAEEEGRSGGIPGGGDCSEFSLE